MKYFGVIRKVFAIILKSTPIAAALTVFLSACFSLMPAITTYAMAQLLEVVESYLNGNGILASIYRFGLLYILIRLIEFCFKTVLSVVNNYGIFEKNMHYLHLCMGEKYASLPLIDFENSEIYDMGERADYCVRRDVIPRLFLRMLNNATALIGIISLSLVLATYNIWFLPLCILSGIPYLFARFLRGKEFYALKHHQAKKTRRMQYLWSLFHNSQSIKELRTMGSEEYITGLWRTAHDEVNEELWQYNIMDSKTLFLCDLLKTVAYFIAIGFAFYLVSTGEISVGLFGASIFAIQTVQEKVKTLMIDFGVVTESIHFAKDFFDFMELPCETERTNVKRLLEDTIRFDNVSFQYPNSEKHALDNLSITIKKGEKVVILGENGSGKTTLSKLLLGLYQANSGDVLYDGIDVCTLNRDAFFLNVSSLPQDFGRYKFTLRQNVALSDTSNIDNDAKIRSILEDLGLEKLAHDSIDEQIGREFSGKEYSGGQWQKIAIARSLFKKSELIILDEPTSALDPLVETEILKEFIRICEGKTAIIISHRTGLCRLADKIIIMKNGIATETGTHNELMAKGNEYARLFESQAKWY